MIKRFLKILLDNSSAGSKVNSKIFFGLIAMILVALLTLVSLVGVLIQIELIYALLSFICLMQGVNAIKK